MRFWILLVMIFAANLLQAQSLKRMIDKSDDNNIIETYYVLSSDNAIRQGTYQMMKYHKLSITGTYENNRKTGNWKEYDFSGKKVIKEMNYRNDTLDGAYIEFFNGGGEYIKGTYKNGNKHGAWSYHDWTGKIFESGFYNNGIPSGLWNFYNGGKLFQQYDYNRKNFLINDDTTHYENFIVYDQHQQPVDTLDRGPQFLGGPKHLLTFIGTEMNYPDDARTNEVEGIVEVDLFIASDGSIASAKMITGIGSGCNNEAVRILQLTSGHWIPAADKGKPVAVHLTVPVRFELQ